MNDSIILWSDKWFAVGYHESKIIIVYTATCPIKSKPDTHCSFQINRYLAALLRVRSEIKGFVYQWYRELIAQQSIIYSFIICIYVLIM